MLIYPCLAHARTVGVILMSSSWAHLVPFQCQTKLRDAEVSPFMNSLHMHICSHSCLHINRLWTVCVNFDLLTTGFSMCLQGESLAVGSQYYNWVTTYKITIRM